jgi:PAS domain S-box-containing protein
LDNKVKNINEITSELFQILSDLSKISSPDRIMLVFVNALDNLFNDMNFSFDSGNEKHNDKYFLEINTQNKSYGKIFLNGNLNIVDPARIALLQNAVSLLAVILERIEHQEMFNYEGNLLTQMAKEKEKPLGSDIELFDNISENSPDIIFRFSKDLECLYANKNMSVYLNGNNEKLEGVNLREMKFPMKLQNQLASEINKAFKRKTLVTKTIFSTVTDKVFELHLIPEVIDKVDVKTVLGIGRDITYKFRIERELIEAKEKAEKSDKLKLAFLSNISHEIRTPLNGIIGFTRLFTRKEISDERRNDYLKIIESSTDALLQTMSNILEISKIESDEFSIYCEKININEFISDFYSEFVPKWKRSIKSGINFELELPETKINILYSDEYRLKEILINLIDNAFKFTNQGYVKIGYQIKQKDVVFFVKDSGIGIKKENLARIFNCFHQVDYSERKEYGGLGLGLTISKAVVEKLGGKIWIESIYNKGSTIYFKLPLYQTEQKLKRIKPEKNGFIKIER